MKAVLLAAGKGERLKGTVDDIPKPMIRYKGKPILQYNIELCRLFGVSELFINTHHLPEVIRSYFGDGSAFGVQIHYSYEEEMLGTAGALNNFRDRLSRGEFFVLYGDNLSNFDLASLMKEFQTRDCVGVIAFHYREDVSQSGVGEFAKDGRILRFVEKPAAGATDSHWVNAGIYYLSPRILQHIPPGFSDFARDIIPDLLNQNISLYGVRSNTPLKAFDTPDLLHDALGGHGDS
jgi:NDP-sugar pyrophosphorylase family protein